MGCGQGSRWGTLLCHASHQFWWHNGCTHRPRLLPCIPHDLQLQHCHQEQEPLQHSGQHPGLHTNGCIFHALLQHADLTEAHKWKYNGSHLIVPHGTQYKTLFPKITMPCNHQGLLINHSSGKPYPMVPVGDFSLVDKIFPGSPVDSLLFSGEELARLKRKRYQVSTF